MTLRFRKKIVPEYVTKCFGSNNEQEIENALILAKLQGFTVEEIKEEFQQWKKIKDRE